MKISIFFFVVIMMIAGCTEQVPKQSAQTWQLIYQNDFDSRPINGFSQKN